MRSTIVIDNALLAEAQCLTGIVTKREAVEIALQLLVRVKRQERVRAERGRLGWEGDLDASRQER